MAFLAAWVLAIGLADLVAEWVPNRRPWPLVAPPLAALLGTGSLVYVLEVRALAGWALVAIPTSSSFVWLAARRKWASPSPAVSVLLLLGFLLSLGVVVASSGGLADVRPETRFDLWFETFPFRFFDVSTPDVFLLGLTLLLGQAGTANALVRLVLAAAGSGQAEGEPILRGGRIIGPLERFLIFGFVLSGQFLGAGLIATAKTILRFPELTNAAEDGHPKPSITDVTEYFVLGSLSSWTVAVSSALLVWSAR